MNTNTEHLPYTINAILEALPRVLAGVNTDDPLAAASFIIDELQFCINLLNKELGAQDDRQYTLVKE